MDPMVGFGFDTSVFPTYGMCTVRHTISNNTSTSQQDLGYPQLDIVPFPWRVLHLRRLGHSYHEVRGEVRAMVNRVGGSRGGVESAPVSSRKEILGDPSRHGGFTGTFKPNTENVIKPRSINVKPMKTSSGSFPSPARG